MSSLMLRRARLVGLGDHDVPDHPVDLRIENGIVAELGLHLQHPVGMPEYDAGGRWVIPGLWDQHVHLGQWVMHFKRLDLSCASSVFEVVGRVAARIAEAPDHPLISWGHRSAGWERPLTVADVDAVAGDRIVVLISGDGHHAVLSSAALRALDLPLREGPVEETEWFATYPRLGVLLDGEATPASYAKVMAAAAALGVVGVVDLEFNQSVDAWSERWQAGANSLRVRVGAYQKTFDEFLSAGLRTGMPMPGCDHRVTAGPLKVISDGSLNTMTAWCCERYPNGTHGAPNLTAADLMDLMREANDTGFEVAAHAIGDAAVTQALDSFEATGASGSIEHAQLMTAADIERMGRLRVRASVQPAHLLDDRDITEQLWADRSERCFPFRALLDAGVPLALGSDAPVSPLDPWLAMAAAVHRSADERPAWHPEQAITATEALRASVDGHGTLSAGSLGDVAVLDRNPLGPLPDQAPDQMASSAARADWLRKVRVDATVMAGRIIHNAL